MNVYKLAVKVMLFTAAVFLSGCARLQETYEAAVGPEVIINQPDYNKKKFVSSESQSQNPTVVESVLELSEKYARLSEKAAKQQLENHALSTENDELKGRIAQFTKDFAQAQKELSEANRFLLDMHIELGKWKHDVLGYRREMRQAEKAQLQALVQILQILGAEVTTESSQNESATVGRPSSSKPAQSEKVLMTKADE